MKLSEVGYHTPFTTGSLRGTVTKVHVSVASPLMRSTLIKEVYGRGDCLLVMDGQLFIGNKDWEVFPINESVSKVDPYSSLKVAHAMGQPIEVFVNGVWIPFQYHWKFTRPVDHYRLKRISKPGAHPFDKIKKGKDLGELNVFMVGSLSTSKCENGGEQYKTWKEAVIKLQAYYDFKLEKWKLQVAQGNTTLSFEQWENDVVNKVLH